MNLELEKLIDTNKEISDYLCNLYLLQAEYLISGKSFIDSFNLANDGIDDKSLIEQMSETTRKSIAKKYKLEFKQERYLILNESSSSKFLAMIKFYRTDDRGYVPNYLGIERIVYINESFISIVTEEVYPNDNNIALLYPANLNIENLLQEEDFEFELQDLVRLVNLIKAIGELKSFEEIIFKNKKAKYLYTKISITD